MAISQRAREQLSAFAADSAVGADMAAAPWQRAALEASTLSANAGAIVRLSWSVPTARLPVFLKFGGSTWEQVSPVGRRNHCLALADVQVTLRVGPHVAKHLTIQCVLPPPEIHIYPAETFAVPVGHKATVEIYATNARQLAIREAGEPWQHVPNTCALEVGAIFGQRVIEVQVTAWDGSETTKSIKIELEQAKQTLFNEMFAESLHKVSP